MANFALPAPLEQIVALLKQLPGLGPRSGTRIAFALLHAQQEFVPKLIAALNEIQQTLLFCPVCHGIDTTQPCAICADPRRNQHLICVVESLIHLYAIEKARVFSGQYFVLNGLLSPLDGVTPETLKIPKLINRVARLKPASVEVILAMNLTLEGNTTGHVIAQHLESLPHVRVTRPARGLAAGADLEYSDPLSVSAAFKARSDF